MFGLNTSVAQLQFFFLPTSSSHSPCFVRVALFRSRAIEGWRGVVRSMPMCIYAVGAYTLKGYSGGYGVNYVVYVWTGRIRMEYRS